MDPKHTPTGDRPDAPTNANVADADANAVRLKEAETSRDAATARADKAEATLKERDAEIERLKAVDKKPKPSSAKTVSARVVRGEVTFADGTTGTKGDKGPVPVDEVERLIELGFVAKD